MDIVQERLEREYDVDIIVTAPSVSYRVNMKSGEQLTISSPSLLPDGSLYDSLEEPWIKMEVVCSKDTVGGVMKLVQDRRGIHKNLTYMDENRVLLLFEMPLATVIIDFYDGLKNVSSGYASMNYEFLEYREENLVRLDILIHGEKIDSLAVMCHRTEAETLGRRLAKKLKEVIPRAQFAIPIQAAIGGKVVARETVSAFRKDVTAGLYGGDVTRKNKQLQKQKKGKKRMKDMGSVSLPQEAFHAILKKDWQKIF